MAILIRAWWLAALVTAGCSARTEVDLTLRFDPSFGDEAIRAIRSLHFEVTGDRRPFSTDIAIAHELDAREGRLVYHPGVESGTLGLAVSAFGALAEPIARERRAEVTLQPSRAVAAALTLLPAVAGPSCAALFCDDFEEAMLRPADWTVDSVPPVLGQLAVDTTRALRGAQALHIAQPARQTGGTGAFVKTAANKGLSFPEQPMYVRSFIYYSGPVGVSPDLIFLRDGTGLVAFGPSTDGHIALSTTGPAPFQGRVSSDPFPLDTWACFEFALLPSGDGGSATVNLSLDGRSLPELQLDSANVSMQWDRLTLAFAATFAGDLPDVNVWFDALIVDDKPIGCSK